MMGRMPWFDIEVETRLQLEAAEAKSFADDPFEAVAFYSDTVVARRCDTEFCAGLIVLTSFNDDPVSRMPL